MVYEATEGRNAGPAVNKVKAIQKVVGPLHANAGSGPLVFAVGS
jgi:hypothetical protein